MIRKTILAAGILIASVASATADPVKLGLQPWLGYGPLWIAEKEGYFEKRGVDVELTTFNWDQDMTAALASGNLNVIAGATNSMISNLLHGVDQKGFLIMDVSFQADAVIAKGDIASVADLKGKQIAFEAGSTSDLLINYALSQNGMTMADVTHVPMGASEAGLALIAGRVDAAVSYEPYISTALAQADGFKVLYTAAEKPGLISDMLSADSTWIAANPDAVRGLVLAWDDAVQFMRENPDAAADIIATAVGSPMEEFLPAFKGVKFYNLAENAEALNGDFQATIAEIGQIMHDTNPGEIDRVPAPEEILSLDILKDLSK